MKSARQIAILEIIAEKIESLGGEIHRNVKVIGTERVEGENHRLTRS